MYCEWANNGPIIVLSGIDVDDNRVKIDGTVSTVAVAVGASVAAVAAATMVTATAAAATATHFCFRIACFNVYYNRHIQARRHCFMTKG